MSIVEKTHRVFVYNPVLEEVARQQGIVMVVGETDNDLAKEGHEYMVLNVAIRPIKTGSSKGQLELIYFNQLPQDMKEALEDQLKKEFER